MSTEADSKKLKDWKEKIAIYITYNGLPLFVLPFKADDNSYILISSFLHTIDILAEETRKKIGRSADFYGFNLVNNVQVEVLEILDEDSESMNKIRLFIQTPYGKEPMNRSAIAALFGATRAIAPKIRNNEINLYKTTTGEYFKEELKERGYTPDKVMSELEHLTDAQVQFSDNIPISLFSIEKETRDENGYKLVERGNYNKGSYKKNPVKNELGELTFDSGLIIGLAEALKSYQSTRNIEMGEIILRFKDFSLVFYYKKDDLPVIGVFIQGTGKIEEIKRYHNDLRELEIGN
jgi:hypothetical protein